MNVSFDQAFNNSVYRVDDSLTETYVSTKLNEGFRSTELATLTTIEQRQESGKTVIEIGCPLSKSTFEKVRKMISSTKQKSVGEEASKQEQIDEFLRKYKSFNDVPVKDMRHIIPLLLMEVYVEKHGQYTKKVKGLWEKRPDDWPENIPFVDPNNSLKNEGERKNVKPKKELLGQMLTYLVDRYTKMKSVAEASDSYLLHADDPLMSFPHESTMQNDDLNPYELNLIETNESELRAAEQSVSDGSFSTGHSSGFSYLPGYGLVFSQDVKPSLSSATNDGSINPSSLSTLDDTLSGGMDVGNGELVEDGPGGSGLRLQWFKLPDLDARPPEQVVDNEEETSSGKDWNPLEEICERTKLKLGYMKTKVPLPKGVQNQLENIHGILKNLTVSVMDDIDATLKLIEKWSELELCIDMAKFQKPCKCSDKIQNLHDELVPKVVPSMDFMDNNTMKCKSVDLPVPEQDSQQFNSLLNIRPRPGPAGGRVLFPPGNQLEVRCLASEQSALNNGCMVSTLSDNHKPIQLAQEDRDDQNSEKPEFSDLTRDEMFPFSIDDLLTDFLFELTKDVLPPSKEVSEPSQEMSCPVQESAPLTESTPQLAGKFEMPVDPFPHVMTSVSVHPWASAANSTMMSTPSFVFSSLPTTVVPSQPIPNPSIQSPTFAAECMSRLSLSVNRDPFPPPVQKAIPWAPMQPLLDQLLSRPKAGGRPGSKRCRTMDEDDELDENVSGPSKPAKAPTYNTMIPLVVEEISNNLDKPFPRLLKKKSR